MVVYSIECGGTVFDPETKEFGDTKKLPLNGVKHPELEQMIKSCVTFSDAKAVLEFYGAQAYIKSDSLCYYPTENGTLLFVKYMEEEKITVNSEIPDHVLDQLADAPDRDALKDILAANNIDYNKDVDSTITKDGHLAKETIAAGRDDGAIGDTRKADSAGRGERAAQPTDTYAYYRQKAEEREKQAEGPVL